MKNIVIVNATSTGKNYVYDIIRRNYRPCILEPSLSSKANINLIQERQALRKQFESVAEYLEEKETYAETLEMIRALNPVLVIPGAEHGVRLAARLADDLRLPGNSYANIDKYTNKNAMHEALKARGIRSIRGKVVHSEEEAIAFYREEKLRGCVVKPEYGAASSGVHLCDNEVDMLAAIRENMAEVNVFGDKVNILIQERIVGTEYIVNTVSCEGKHRLSSIWRYQKKKVEGGGNVYEYAELITHLEVGHRRLIQYAYNVADAVEYRYGAIHVEFIVDEKGPVLIEINCRVMGAGMTAEYLDDVLGHHETDNVLDSYLNPRWHDQMLDAPYRPYKKAYMYFFITPEDMKVAMSPALPLITHLRSYFAGSIGSVASGCLDRTVDLETMSGMLYLKHENELVVRNDVEFLQTTEQQYFDMLFLKDKAVPPRIPEKLESVEDMIPICQCNRSILVLTNDETLDVNASIVRVGQGNTVVGKYNWGILDWNYREDEDIESIVADFYALASKIQKGGHILIPERTYWHLPCGMESVEILAASAGYTLEAPGINSGKAVKITVE